MNILPHKSWHVRTKANIAKVRKDQAKAAEEEAEKQRRVAVADYEARINLLRTKANKATSTQINESNRDHELPIEVSSKTDQHVDLFADFEDKMKKVKPMDEEKRLEQEKYEKQIGYLTYLGQDTHEALGTRSWYDVAPKKTDSIDESGQQIEVGLKVKHLHDPMHQFLKKSSFIAATPAKSSEKIDTRTVDKSDSLEVKQIPIGMLLKKRERSITPKKRSDRKRSKSSKKSKEKKKKHKKEKKKRKHSSDDSESEELRQHKMENLQKLREARLQREKEEQNRSKEFLRQKFPSLLPPEEKVSRDDEAKKVDSRAPYMKQKYNTQFNPMLAKQNYG